MKKFICSMMAAIVFLLSPISAYASTTESAYEIMPLYLTDDEIVTLNGHVSVVDLPLSNTIANSINLWQSINIDSNVRFSSNAGTRRWFKFETAESFSGRQLRYEWEITHPDDTILAFTNAGFQIQIYGMQFPIQLMDENSNVSAVRQLTKSDFVSAKIYFKDQNGSTLLSGNVNSNDFSSEGNFFKLTYSDSSVDVSSLGSVYQIDIMFYFNVPDIVLDYPFINCGFGFYSTENYIAGDILNNNSSSSSTDYNKNVEAELGNIQTGIDNVINSVVQMGNQAWEGAQQTVQAVTQMTEQLNSAIDQQRQDILEGLGLLGDDLDNSLNNVKTEITNIGSSITNKLESTTESITNKIESTTETITNTIETKVDEVTAAVDNVKESVTEVKDSILDLPNKIKDMLLGLIVPDAETMSSKFSEFSGLLEHKLGVIYQIPMMLFDFFDTIVNAATTPQASLTLPAFTLPWIDGTTLTVWQPVEYNIIPEGMEVLSDLIQTITSMTCVVLTFSSIKRAYERFLRS